MNDQAQKLRELAKNSSINENKSDKTNDKSIVRCKSIAVTSGKGGVGKSNIALYLSIFLSAFKKKVLLMDADLGLANVHILLGVAPEKNIAHFIDGECSIEEVICNGPAGVDIIPGASGLEKLANIDCGRLEFFQHEFMKLEKMYDYLIIDTGAGIGNVVTQFASHTDASLLIMTPEPTSLADAYAMVKVLYDKGCTTIGVIVNMSSSDREGNETFDRLNTLVVKFLKKPLELFGIIPLDRDVSEYVKRQRLIVFDKGHERFNNKIMNIARKISGVQYSKNQSFFSRFLNLVSPLRLIE